MGADILLLSRDLKLVDYADITTKQLLEKIDERTICVLSPALYDVMGSIIELVENASYTLVDLKSTSLTDMNDVEAAVSFGLDINDIARSEPLVVVSFRGVNSIASVCKIINSSPYADMGLVCPKDSEEVVKFASFFLKNRPTATFEECTCCVLKPRSIIDRLVGSIIHSIVSRGFIISAIQMFRMERSAAAEFLELYDGVLPEYKDMVNEMCSGPVIALEVRLNPSISCEKNIVDAFRSHAGPWDEHMAKEIAPDSIRGKFGNVIHCTDLPKDGVHEVDYFFNILNGAHYIDR